MEDVEALEMFVASVGAVDLPSMTCRWEAFRKPRVEKVKAFGRANGSFYTSQGKPAGAANGNASGKDKGGAPSAVDINTVEPDREAPFLSPPFHKWLYHYDTVSEVSMRSVCALWGRTDHESRRTSISSRWNQVSEPMGGWSRGVKEQGGVDAERLLS